jgi:hypothetical protein
VIQVAAQKIAGMPVAFAMFTASVGTDGANGEERKKTVLRSSKAFKIHWTARKLTKNVARRAPAYLAMRIKPTTSDVPASKVKGIPDHATPENTGLKTP